MPADHHTHRPESAERPQPLDPNDTAPTILTPTGRGRHATGISVALTVVTVLVIVAAVLGVFMWLAAG